MSAVVTELDLAIARGIRSVDTAGPCPIALITRPHYVF